jgi:hypothetical protein
MNNMKMSLRYALGIYGALVTYFFSMKLLGLGEITQLRLFNFFIVMGGIYLLLRRNMKENNDNYFQNLFLGFRTGAMAIVLTVVSLFVYLKAINPAFIEVMEHSMIWGNHLSVFQVTVAIGIEGIASSFLLTYMVMQYMKNFADSPGIREIKE